MPNIIRNIEVSANSKPIYKINMLILNTNARILDTIPLSKNIRQLIQHC